MDKFDHRHYSLSTIDYCPGQIDGRIVNNQYSLIYMSHSETSNSLKAKNKFHIIAKDYLLDMS
jgi:hypothetical protein